MKKQTAAVTALFAAVGGMVAGWLTAPKSGEETREDLIGTVNGSIKDVEMKLKKAHTDLSQNIDDLSDSIKGKRDEGSKLGREKLKEAKETQTKVKTLITTVRSGDTDNAELEKALKQAKNSIANIKKFMSS